MIYRLGWADSLRCGSNKQCSTVGDNRNCNALFRSCDIIKFDHDGIKEDSDDDYPGHSSRSSCRPCNGVYQCIVLLSSNNLFN
eukprot:m.134847 g.134847  ORF g.134847 m.134847 type:complete len:83 (-) comp13115_c1_seq1:7244-7492(-)